MPSLLVAGRRRVALRCAFTLIEVLVVLVVLAIVIAFAMTRLTAPVSSAKKLEGRATIKNSVAAAQSYYLDQGQTYNRAAFKDIPVANADIIALSDFIETAVGVTSTAFANTANPVTALPSGNDIGVWIGNNGKDVVIKQLKNGSTVDTFYFIDNDGVIVQNVKTGQ